MKIFIRIGALVILLVFSLCSTAQAIDWNVPWDTNKRTKKIEKSSDKGYSESQRDYKSRKRKSEKKKQSAGYKNGKYRVKGEKHQHHEWQFID